jgi:hypothetical protein
MKANGECNDSITRPGGKIIVKADDHIFRFNIERILCLRLGRLVADCTDEKENHYCVKVSTSFVDTSNEAFVLSFIKGIIDGVPKHVCHGQLSNNKVIYINMDR